MHQIAVSGADRKRKSFAAAILVRLLKDAGMRPVLAVDADPDMRMASLLGVSPAEQAINVLERVLGQEGQSKELLLDQCMQQECVAEGKGFDLLTMGRPGGLEAHCYLRTVFIETLDNLKKNYQAVVMDCEPKLDYLFAINRSDIDCLLVAADPDSGGPEKAARILARAAKLEIKIRRRILAWGADPGSESPAALTELGLKRGVDAILGLSLDRLASPPAASGGNAMTMDLPPDLAGQLNSCLFGSPARTAN